jgi:hypothetical protein
MSSEFADKTTLPNTSSSPQDMITFASLAQGPIVKVASATALATASFGIGYFLGSWTPSSYYVHQLADDDREASDGDLSALQGIGPCKLVLIVRTDINMTPGDISAEYVRVLTWMVAKTDSSLRCG